MIDREEAEVMQKPKRARWFVLAIIVAAFFVGCPLFYISGSVDGRIVDSVTGEPIPNAHIVGIWELEGGLFEHAYLGPLHFEETVSDSDGRYHLDGFSIQMVPLNMSLAQLEDSDPVIYIFAKGYQPIGRSGGGNAGKVYRKSSLNGIDIPLNKMSGNNQQEFSGWDDSIGHMKVELKRCDLLELTQTIKFLKSMQVEFKKLGSPYTFVHKDEYSICK